MGSGPRADREAECLLSTRSLDRRLLPSVVPSRRPRRDRVAFFDTSAAAVTRNFGPACDAIRTRPTHPPIHGSRRFRRACVLLGNVDGIRRWRRSRRGSAAAPITCSETSSGWSASRRANTRTPAAAEVKRELRRGGDVTAAMFDAGYGSSSRFYERAVPKLGMAPSVYQRGGAGMTSATRWSTRRSGSCWSQRRRAGSARSRWAPRARSWARAVARISSGGRSTADDAGLSRWTKQIVAHLEGRAPRLDLPSTCRRRRFSGRCGRRSRRSLTERPAPTAKSPRRRPPRAVRAVARACATNPVALGDSVSSGRAGAGRRRWIPMGSGKEEGASGAEGGEDGQDRREGQDGQDRREGLDGQGEAGRQSTPPPGPPRPSRLSSPPPPLLPFPPLLPLSHVLPMPTNTAVLPDRTVSQVVGARLSAPPRPADHRRRRRGRRAHRLRRGLCLCRRRRKGGAAGGSPGGAGQHGLRGRLDFRRAWRFVRSIPTKRSAGAAPAAGFRRGDARRSTSQPSCGGWM